MPFTVSWTVIPSGDLDPDSPITTELMTALYTNGVYLKEWIGDQSAATVNHAHAGLGTDGTAQIAVVPSHSHTGIEDAELSATGTDDNEFATGSVGFAPQLAWVTSVFNKAGVYSLDGISSGVIRGTGGAGISMEPVKKVIDNGGAGGIDTGGSPYTTSYDEYRLQCTQFSSSAIKFQAVATGGIGIDGAWTVYVIAMRWSS